MTYASTEQLRQSLRLTSSVDDELLILALSAADEAIDAWCGRPFGVASADSTRYFAAAKSDVVEVDDLHAITSVATSADGTTWTATTAWQAEPLNGRADGMAWPTTRLRATGTTSWPTLSGVRTVRVTGRFAFGTVPSSVVQAAVLTASRIFARLSSPLGVAGFGEMGAVQVRASDVDVVALLNPYRIARLGL